MSNIIVNNTNNEFSTIIKNIKSLSEEGRKKAIRRARDMFNKNKNLQEEMTAQMIMGGNIKIDDLC